MNKFIYQGMAFRKFRKETPYSIRDVAKRMDKSPIWLSEIELGKKNVLLPDARKLCSIYNHTLDELCKWIDYYTRTKPSSFDDDIL